MCICLWYVLYMIMWVGMHVSAYVRQEIVIGFSLNFTDDIPLQNSGLRDSACHARVVRDNQPVGTYNQRTEELGMLFSLVPGGD